MNCKVCHEEATAACGKCGGFYCTRHGGRSFSGPRCAPCYDRWRPMLVTGAILEAAAGIFVLFIPGTLLPGSAAMDFGSLFVFLALGAFGFAAFFLWAAIRQFP